MVSKKKQLIPLRYRIIAVLILIGLAVGALGIRQAVFYAVEKRQRQAFDNVTSTTINRIAELAVLEYRYTDVMELNRRFAVGGVSTSLIRFSGVIKAGLSDTSGITAGWNRKENRIDITLPRSVILDNTVDISSVRIWDVRRNIFVPISTDIKILEVTAFKERVANELGLSGFMADADSRAAELVAGLYAGFGADVAVRFITTETVE